MKNFSFYAETKSGKKLELFWTPNFDDPNHPIKIGARNSTGYEHKDVGYFTDKDGTKCISLNNEYINDSLLGQKVKGLVKLINFNQHEVDEASNTVPGLKQELINSEIALIEDDDNVELIMYVTGYGKAFSLKNKKLSYISSKSFERVVSIIHNNKLAEFTIEDMDSSTYTFVCTYKQFKELSEKASIIINDQDEKRKANHEAQNIKKTNIENGAIYFTTESAPHDEDLSNVLLNRPAPNMGAFTLDHRISTDLFNRVKAYAVYYSKDWLEECDMFFSNPGWRFSKLAIEELAKTNKVFIDNKEYSK